MDSVKDKMYDYETTPPVGVWEAIASQLDGNEAKVIPLTKKNNTRLYYMAAASVAVIILAVVFFIHRSSNSISEGLFTSSSGKPNNGSSQQLIDTSSGNKMGSALITVPEEEKDTFQKDNDEDLLAKNIPVKGGPNENISKEKENTKKTDSAEKTPDDKKTIATTSDSRYITIEGLQGQPVKVSTKMALLIDSSDNKVPPKPSWNKKINEWREIMKGNTLAPTPGNFLDIIELTKTLKDHNKP